MIKHTCVWLLLLAALVSNAQQLPVWENVADSITTTDWLVKPINCKATVYLSADSKDIILYNGLVKRTFRLQPNLTCTEYKNMSNGQQLLRAIMPEAIVIINGTSYKVGGLYGQKEKAYLLPEWLDNLTAQDNDFHFISYTISPVKPFLNWNSSAVWAMNKQQPTGKTISFLYRSKLTALQGIDIKVKYELYDGIPLIVKSISIINNQNNSIVINRAVNEVLATVEEESAVVGTTEQMEKQHGIYVETNYAFNNAMRYDLSDQTTHWLADSSYTSQVNYNYQTPCILEVYPSKVTGLELPPKDTFNSVRSYELLMDDYDRERRGLAIRRMYSVIAPWTTANPIFMHLVSKKDEEVIHAIDQCKSTGYEALILSFGSHCNIEDTSAGNIAKWKKLADYAHQEGILIGGYSLFSSRKISDEDDVIDPVTGLPDKGAFFGNAPCMGSKWGLTYLDKLKYFISNTGFNLFENDGPYPGDVCASTNHSGHKNLDDSQWKQMELQKDLYHWCNEHGVYVNAPDWYFLDGTNKIAIGYREVNFSLPREQQMILNRQNIYDGLWEKTSSMSWGFVPLTKYQGGGSEAVLEPLSEHLRDYKQLMMQYYGAGVQACYRGPRLYDTDLTKQEVINTINWYKKFRAILNSSLIHLQRANGRDWDGWLHVNPQLQTKSLLMLFNPLKQTITRTITVPLYYAGLNGKAILKEKDSAPKKMTLNKNNELTLQFTLAPESYSWYVIE
jgi:hypothetical protein